LRPALRHPAVTLVVAVGLLLALAGPALGMKLAFPGMEDLPRTTAAMQAYDRLVAAFPSTGTSHLVAVRVPSGQPDATKAKLVDLAARTQGDPLFAPLDGEPEIRVSADRQDGTMDVGAMDILTMDLATPYAGRSEEARQSLRKLRTELMPATVGTVP